MIRFAIGLFLAALTAAPALAAPVSRAELIRLAATTDIAPSKVAIAGPHNIYSVERLGPPALTGEVIALVRIESADAQRGDTRAVRSWDAHVIFDCKGARMRVIRSASYPEPNRHGPPKIETRVEDWFSPAPEEPAAKLLAAACDDTYDWPLEGQVAEAAPSIEQASVRKDAVPAAADRAQDVARQVGDVATSAAATAPTLSASGAWPEVADAPGSEAPKSKLREPRRTEARAEASAPTPAVTPKRRFAALIAPATRAASFAGSCKRLLLAGTRSLGLAFENARRDPPHQTRHAAVVAPSTSAQGATAPRQE